MTPGSLYILALFLIAGTLMPFSRMALLVVLAWLPGHFSYNLILACMPGHTELAAFASTLVDMCIALVAFGAAMALYRDKAGEIIAVLFLLGFFNQCGVALGATTGHDGWWLEFAIALSRVLLVPFTVDWGQVMRLLERADEWFLDRLAAHFGERF